MLLAIRYRDNKVSFARLITNTTNNKFEARLITLFFICFVVFCVKIDGFI